MKDSIDVRPRLLMAVFNETRSDGRVLRSAEAISSGFDVKLVGLGRRTAAPAGAVRPFLIEDVDIPARLPRVFRQIYFWLRLWRAAIRWRPAVVYAHDYFLAWPGWLTARLCGARLVYDAHELIVPEGDRTSLRRRIFYRLERWTVTRADLVVAANEDRSRIMQRHYGLARLPVVIRNIPPQPAEVRSVEDVERRHPQLRRGRPDLVRLVYQGDLNRKRGIGAFLHALEYLEDRYQVVLIGAGPDAAELREEAMARGLSDRAIFLGRVPLDELQDLLPVCDIGIITYAMLGLNNIYCAPNKLYEYAFAGLPVLATCQPPLEAALRKWRVGRLVGCTGASGDEFAEEIAKAARCVAAAIDDYRSAIPAFLAENRWQDEARRLGRALAGVVR